MSTTKRTRRKMIYLASPYSHRDKAIQAERYCTITKIAGFLTHKYRHTFFLPITQSHNMAKFYAPLKNGTFKAWKDIDYLAIRHCEEVWVVVLPGWDTSTGVTAEIKYAKRHKIPVHYVAENAGVFL